MTGDSLSVESDDTKDGGSDDDDDDDASIDSTDSLGQYIKSTNEAIPHDAFMFFNFWMPNLCEYHKPCLLNYIAALQFGES